MMRNIVGGCLCGAVRYSGEAEPVAMYNCHCRDCQRVSGAAFGSDLLVPRAALSLSGAITWFELRSDSGRWVRRGFCPACGSRLLALIEAAPEFIEVAATSLDDPAWFRPDFDMYTSSAQEWCQLDPELPRYPKMPPLG